MNGKTPEDFWKSARKADDAPRVRPVASAVTSGAEFGLARNVRLGPEPPREERLAKVKAAVCPLLEAAMPMLRFLGAVPKEADEEVIEALHVLLVREVTTFESICNDAQIKHEHVVAGSYALCTAVDEAINRTAWGGGTDGETGAWAGRQLAQQFHNDAHGGEKVFLLIGRLSANQHEHIDLLDLLFFVLSMGFAGRYRSAPNGKRQLEAIRHGLFDMVAPVRGEVPRELSPNWKGEAPGKFRTLTDLPVWVTVCVLSLVLLTMYGYYKYQLVKETDRVVGLIREVGAMRPPERPVHKALRLKELLAPEIAAGSVSVEESDNRSSVSFKGDDMFAPGKASVSATLRPTIAKVASEINEVTGTVRVTGHSDNRPIGSREFPDNQALSEKRAGAVADVLVGGGVAIDRIVVEGKGDAVPLVDNGTAAGRARNRRVDIVVTQGDVSPRRIEPPQSIKESP